MRLQERLGPQHSSLPGHFYASGAVAPNACLRRAERNSRTTWKRSGKRGRSDAATLALGGAGGPRRSPPRPVRGCAPDFCQRSPCRPPWPCLTEAMFLWRAGGLPAPFSVGGSGGRSGRLTHPRSHRMGADTDAPCSYAPNGYLPMRRWSPRPSGADCAAVFTLDRHFYAYRIDGQYPFEHPVAPATRWAAACVRHCTMALGGFPQVAFSTRTCPRRECS